jgi:DNA-binding IclR family transcriptional regulator
VLGPEALLMGSVAAARFPVEDLARPSLRRLAEETGESAFFSIRRGAETVCLLREEGSFPVRSFVLHEGVRFPLGVASAGTAIMAFLPEAEQEQILGDWTAHAGKYAKGHPEDVIRDNLKADPPAGLLGEPRSGAGRQLGDGRGGLRPGRPSVVGAVPDRDRTTLP